MWIIYVREFGSEDVYKIVEPTPLGGDLRWVDGAFQDLNHTTAWGAVVEDLDAGGGCPTALVLLSALT